MGTGLLGGVLVVGGARAVVLALAGLCEQRDWLLLVDEVQTGIGRTGTLFAFQQYGIRPDAVSFAKGIAGGLPMCRLPIPSSTLRR